MARILTADSPAVAAGSPLQRARIAITGIVAILILLVFASHYGITMSMVDIYDRNETFAHCYLVVPMVLWLVWRRGGAAAAQPIAVSYYPLALLALTVAIGWLATRINVVFVSQFAMVAMVPLLVWLVLGTAATRELAFPLFLLFFAVPFGDFLVPQLIEWTGDFVVAAIRASGVPIYREGNLLTIPTGRWSIVEACAGLRYLIASLLVGVLFAYLSYRSAWRRAAFIAAAIVVPIVANWLRAYMIVMLGHLTNNRLAVGIDHIIYGWLFFGVVMLILFSIGSRWREDRPPGEAALAAEEAALRAASPPLRALRSPLVLVGVLIVLASAVLQAITSSASPGVEARLHGIQAVGDWQATDTMVADWHPDVFGATSELRESFVRRDARVGIHVALFRNQTRDAKAIASTNQLVEPTNKRWVLADAGTATFDRPGGPGTANTAVVSGSGQRLAVVQWFWVDGHATHSRYEAAFYQALAALRGRSDAVAWIVVFAAAAEERAEVPPALRDFVTAVTPALDARLREAIAQP